MEIKKTTYNFKEKQEKSTSSFSDFMTKDLQFGGKKMPDKIKLYFYHEMSMLLGAGLDIKRSLETIVEEQKKEKYKEIFSRITKNVIQGMSLSKALEVEEYFSAHEYYTIQIGEETGKLAIVLEQLFKYYDKKIKQQRQIVGALSYPLIVLGVALMAIIFFMTFLIPMFMDVFNRFDAELPALTKFMVNASHFFSNYMGYIFLVIIGLMVMYYFNKQNQKLRLFVSKVLLKIPYCKGIIQLIQLSNFSQTLSLLIASNTPLSRALFLSKQMTSFMYFQEIIAQVEEDVLRGELLHVAMQKHSFFPKRMTYLVKTGEEVNKLEAIFTQLHSQYSSELDHKTSMMSTILEPVLIIFVGALVAVILISMYLPMFQLGTAIY